MPSRVKSAAIRRRLLPLTYSSKIRRTIFACSGSISLARLVGDKTIAVGERSGDLAFPRAAAVMTPDAIAEILEEHRVDDATNANMDVRNFTVLIDYLDFVKLEPLVNGRGVFLIAGEAVQLFDDHGIKAAFFRRLHQGEKAVALEHAGAGFPTVRINLDNLVALAPGDLFAERGLIVDRDVPLNVA
jgi:hypothetical protein